jgi:hypothetical protein
MKRDRNQDDEPTVTLARDEFSEAWRQTSNHPAAVTKQSTIDVSDFYGNTVTWVVRTVRVEGNDTVFLQRQDGTGGGRWVLPPQVTTVLARHRDGAATVNRKRAARTSAANRKAQGLQPAFLKKERA